MLRRLLARRRQDGQDGPGDLPPDLHARVRRASEELSAWGWCTPRKAVALAALIHRVRPRRVVELGVFGGRSLLPQAIALKYTGRGTIYGVDPWSNDIAVEVATSPENDAWWAEVDLGGAKAACLRAILRHDVVNVVRLLECRSRDALAIVGDGLDIVHIDGHHSASVSLQDATDYFAALAPGGYLWFDDLAWPSTTAAVGFLQARCATVATFEEDDGNRYALFQKPP